jgi:hypothetical protein
MLKRSLVVIAVSSSFFLLSCSGDSTNSPQNVSSTEITQDLQKIANAVDNFGMFEKNEKPGLSKKKVASQDTSFTLRTGVEVFKYSDSDDQYIDTTYTYAMDGVTLIDDYYSLDSYKQSVKTYCFNSKYKSYAALNMVIKNIPTSSDEMDFNYEMTMDGTGNIDYFNDSLILNFNKISCTSNDNSCTYDYHFSMFDGKYNVSLVGTINYDSGIEPAETAVIATGAIKLASTGESAGTFQLLYSEDVRILDNSGVVIKKTH